MHRTRTFIAVEITEGIRGRIVSLQDELARLDPIVKWTEPENLHVTLVFLGEVDNRDIPMVHRIATHAVHGIGRFRASVTGVGCFPNPRRPRTLWVGMAAGAAELTVIHDRLEDPLTDLGYRRENRRYTPHVTLGRVRSDGPMSDLAHAVAQRTTWHAGDMDVSELLIMGSELTRDGPVYTVLGRVTLSAGQ